MSQNTSKFYPIVSEYFIVAIDILGKRMPDVTEEHSMISHCVLKEKNVLTERYLGLYSQSFLSLFIGIMQIS